MGLNVGYLTSDSSSKGDEVYTPFYAVEPILKYLKPNSNILCPFDKEWSAFVIRLQEEGHKVVFSHIEYGSDFFKYDNLEEIDYIISNPPYSIKDQVLEHLYNLKIPFAMLLPIQTLQSLKRVKLFKLFGLELLVFDRRVNYHTDGNRESFTKSNSFGSAYFCKGLLNDKLIFENLEPYERVLE